MTRRTQIVVGVGDILQLLGMAAAVIAVWHLAGRWWGVLLGGAFVVIEANLTYGGKGFAISLPNHQDRIAFRRRLLTPARAASRLTRALASKVRRP
jgi:hypothetical protein